MENKLEALLSSKTIEDLKKYDLYDSSNEIINTTFMINIDENDFKNMVNDKNICAYINQNINTIDDIKINVVSKIEESKNYNGFILIRGNFSTPLNICDEIIKYVDKYLNKEISFIFGFDVTYQGPGLKITSIITD